MKAYIAEGIGTFTLSLVVMLSIATGGSVATPILAGVTLMLFVYTIGSISGCHINPAVTIGLWTAKKIDRDRALWYVASQLIGAVSAIAIGTQFIGSGSRQLTALQTRVTNDPIIGIAEMLGTLIFTFGIMAVVSGKVKETLSGVVIGGSLFIGLSIAGAVSNGVLNPAVGLAIGSMNVYYLIGPILGSILGMWLYSYVVSLPTKPKKQRSSKKK